ncbi:DUF4231 domain-containing protein [Agrobacterium tumefaciens]|nr:DUF4231 domain-containing protein [Agrobacterium tumefaciens]NTD89553.1 DUF4231 domain-containing protein [Agrobacterium tumefaciens]NTD93050.1 DUF4231 domain-containing protein [Agrobacterium tumefaciens]NTE01658.1 DUF4231 domain-containing protein [Agrobacterium tumefaciens]NTE17028.1 DUF4231 domain-containing protein [Agrobacterium tumefaciens]NTE39722.1 DUF4231 domain-containing protein [Agrobacterium tumefaciens]
MENPLRLFHTLLKQHQHIGNVLTMYRKDKTIQADVFTTASAYYSTVRQGYREKADHNKLESQLCFSVIIASTLTAPLFVTLGTGDLWAKGVPSALSVLAGGLTSWLQLRKPQRLWMIYRRAQRELEEHKANFDFRDGEFADCADADQLLARKVTSVSRWVHDAWEGLVPEQESLANSKSFENSKSE